MSHLEQNSGVLKPHRGWSSLVAVCLFLSLQSPPGAADKGPSGLEEGVPGTALLPGEKDTGEEGRERVYLVITATAVLVLFALLAAAVVGGTCQKWTKILLAARSSNTVCSSMDLDLVRLV
ncbi:hypothetical protein AGIG_G5067 [Arapaima gigas]